MALTDLPSLGLTSWGFDCIARRSLDVLADDVSQRDLDTYRAAVRSGAWQRVMGGEKPQVTLSTIHGVKGQEAENVACLMASTMMPAKNLERDERREEEIRLAYVGITRASKRFYGLSGDWLSYGEPYEIFGV